MTIPLFLRFPLLSERLPHITLGEFPTPTVKCSSLGEAIGVDHLYLKNDGVSGAVYGGNKVRKLEFLLGRALKQGRSEVLTFGCAGSNHALATAIYARKLGLGCISMLLPQPNARSVRTNLLAGYGAGARIRYFPEPNELEAGTSRELQCRREAVGREPMVIPPGGSSEVGAIGYVNAALELCDQIAAGYLPEPARIYVPAGTVGTAAGLMVGLRLAGSNARVVCIRVTARRFANAEGLASLASKTVDLLRRFDPSFPPIAVTPSDVDMRDEFLGAGYGWYTEESVEATRLISELEGIRLEGTYTGKTLAALIADSRAAPGRSDSALFWNTCNSRDVSPLAEAATPDELPPPLQRYFEEDVQPLDRSWP